ncbi:MAG: hypothetical protein ACLTWB_13910 [Clostridia bacterium]
MAPFCIAAANGGFYGALDISQHLPAHVADGYAEGVDTIWGGEVVDRLKIVLVEPPGRLKPAAFQQHIGNAHCRCTFELQFPPDIIIAHQVRAVNDAEDVTAVVVPVGLHKFSGHIRQLLTKTFAVNTIVFCQHRPDRLFQGFIDLPQVRVQGVSPRCRIRHIKDIVQARVSAGFIQQRNALGTTPDVTVHFIVPYIILGTGRSIRSLGIDHQLIRVTVFVQPCRCDQKFCPVLPPSRKAVCRFAGKCKIFFGFVWHLKPPFGFRVQKERAAVSSLPAEVWNDLLI